MTRKEPAANYSTLLLERRLLVQTCFVNLYQLHFGPILTESLQLWLYRSFCEVGPRVRGPR